jgi:YHS domain-containing protein
MWANARQCLAGRWLAARWLASCLMLIAACLSSQANASQAHPSLPAGLPGLPVFGERVTIDDLSGVALEGFDPVAYQLQGKPVAGLARYEHSWQGVIWRFASAANRATFAEAPEVYAPKFGGYDATAAAAGRAVATDPGVFAILNDRLYMFRTVENRSRFLTEASLRAKSSEIWPSVAHQLAR